MSTSQKPVQETPTLEELAAACEPVRELTQQRDQAKSARNLAVRQARTQGARKAELQKASRLGLRSVGYVVEGVKPAPVLGVSPDLDALTAAADRLEAAEERLAQALARRDGLIIRAREAKQYRIAQIMEVTGLTRSRLYQL
ncbi:hypothetical protein ACIA8I_39945 [Streptomyces rishiriensis]|uniref:hypothetical protein n=1 Tax=Streptomyces rishiriensis TaxID=68264 RepID=UPI0037A7DC4D